MKESIDLDTAIIQRYSDSILITKYKNGSVVHLEDAIEIDNTHFELSHGNEVFTIVDMGGIENKVTNRAQEYFTKKGKMIPRIKAVGLVMDGVSNRLMARFYMSLYKPYYPTKIFSSRKRAIEWFDKLQANEWFDENSK